MKDRVILITGGAGGIGQAVAHRFLDEGAKVGFVDVSADSLDRVEQSFSEYEGQILTIEADVTNEADVESYVTKLLILSVKLMYSSTTQGLMVHFKILLNLS